MEVATSAVVTYVVTAVAAAVIGHLTSKIKDAKGDNIAMRNGMVSLLRDRIMQACHHYSKKGVCPIYARENISKMFDAYKKLGGNGVVQDLVGDTFELPRD